MLELNENFKSLINSLDPAHKIILNDQSMYLIKLHKNDKFQKWLGDRNILPVKQSYYNINNLPMFEPVGKPIDSHFITVALLGKSGKKDIDFSCCRVDISRLNNTFFSDVTNKSGILCNGSFFYLLNHITNKFYGIADYNKEFYPIGYYRHALSAQGTDISGGLNLSIDNSSVEPLNMTGDYFSLGKIKDYMGILKVTNNIVNIIPLKNYDHSKSNVDDQILLGNLLVHDGKIIISDDLLGMVFTTADISTIKKNTLCQLCDKSGIPLQKQNVILLIEDLNNNKINNIYIKSSEDGKTVVQTKYHWKYINSVFDNNLLKMADPNMMAAKIPPALPMHASDLNPRTCMLVDEFDNVMIVVVEGREKLTGAFGADLFFLAKLCKEFGAKHAINLDGGGSSKLMWREKGFTTSEYVGQDSYTIGNAIIVKPL